MLSFLVLSLKVKNISCYKIYCIIITHFKMKNVFYKIKKLFVVALLIQVQIYLVMLGPKLQLCRLWIKEGNLRLYKIFI